jgi:uncharacterized protein YndB with AHSA1/START domain
MTLRPTPNATSIDIDKNVPLVRITREFNAPPEKVFLAHLNPDLFARWNDPNDTTMTVGHHDCRTGGSYRYMIKRFQPTSKRHWNVCVERSTRRFPMPRKRSDTGCQRSC